MKPKLTFPKSARLLTSEGFSTVFDHVDLKVSSKHILILARKNQQNSARLGLIVAKKHVKQAVHRNRLKRIARERFRLEQAKLPDYDLVLMYKGGSGLADNHVIHKDFDYLWRKLRDKALRGKTSQSAPQKRNKANGK